MDYKESFKWICLLSCCLLTQTHTIRKRDVTEKLNVEDQHSQSLREPQKYTIEPIQTLNKVKESVVTPSYDPVNYVPDNDEIESEKIKNFNSNSTQQDLHIEQDNSENTSDKFPENIDKDRSNYENNFDAHNTKTSINNLRNLAADNSENKELFIELPQTHTNAESDIPNGSVVTESPLSVIISTEKEIETTVSINDNAETVLPTIDDDSQTSTIKQFEKITEIRANVDDDDAKPDTEHLAETVPSTTEKPGSTTFPSLTTPTRPTRRPIIPFITPIRQRPRPPTELRPPFWPPNISLLPLNPMFPALFINRFNTTAVSPNQNQNNYGFGLLAVPWNLRPLSNLTNILRPNRFIPTRPPLNNPPTTAAAETRNLELWNGPGSEQDKQSDEIKENETETPNTTQSNFNFPNLGSENDDNEEPADTQISHVFLPFRYPLHGQIVRTAAENVEKKQQQLPVKMRFQRIHLKSLKKNMNQILYW